MDPNPYKSPETPGEPPRKREGRNLTTGEKIVALVLVAVILLALVLAAWTVTPSVHT